MIEKIKKLPDTEFEIMKLVWTNESPITTSMIMRFMGKEKEWKIQTIVSLMSRMVKRGFLRSEKEGKERTYFPLISYEDYLRFETKNFVKRYHENSFLNLVNTMYNEKSLDDKDIDELLKWAKERRE